MRRWLVQEHPELGQMLAWVDEMFTSEEAKARESGDGIVRWKHAGDKADALEFCRECVARLEPLLVKVCLPYDRDPAVRFQVPLEIPYLDGTPAVISLIGEIDLLVDMGARGVIVWDLKATKDDHYWQKVKGQLVYYCIAVAVMRGGKWPSAAGLLQPMCEQPDPTWVFEAADYTQMFARIVSTCHDIWAGRLGPKADNAGCRYCEYRGMCPKFPKGRGLVTLGPPAVSQA